MNKPKTVEEWNALAAKRRTTQPAKNAMPKPKERRQPLSATTIKTLPLHVVQRPQKGKFKIKAYFMTLLWKKRGTRVFEDFICQCCGKPQSEGWRYVVDDSRVYLCNKCKTGIKPQFTRILYTPMK